MGTKSLGSTEDVKTSQKAVEREERHFLSIPDSKTPWYLMGMEYVDGFVHWYEVGKFRRRVVCSAGLKGKGFAPDDCPVCKIVAGLYDLAKAYREDGDEAKADKIKDSANDLRGKAEFQFKAIRGNRMFIKTKEGKEEVADWDVDMDDSIAEAGILSMSESQFLGLTGMIGDDEVPQITVGDDLVNRVLWTKKESRKGKQTGKQKARKYNAVVWLADEKESDMPEFEIPEAVQDIDIEDNFKVDEEELEKVTALLSGESSEDLEEDEAVAIESDEEDEPDNDALSDVEDDDDEGEDIEEDKDYDDQLDDADEKLEKPKKFKDDIPGKTKGKGKGKGKSKTTTSKGKRSGKASL